MPHKYLIGIVFFLFVLSCKKSQTITYHENGNTYEVYDIGKSGEKDGSYESYYETGKIREKATFRQGQYSGERILYYENGQPEIIEPYDADGQLNGMYKKYHENGVIHIEKPYVNNVIQGTLRVFYPSGQIKEEVAMENNMENGPFTEYFENGTVQWKGTYLNGDNEFGLLEEFDSLGQMIKRMKCDSLGICRTFWRPGMPEVLYDTLTLQSLIQ